MLLIPCPHCGERAQVEFTYGGDATVARPVDPGAVSTGAWFDHVYLRDNPRGPHWEWWQHTSGCRCWIRVHRDSLTHAVLGAVPATGALPGAGG